MHAHRLEQPLAANCSRAFANRAQPSTCLSLFLLCDSDLLVLLPDICAELSMTHLATVCPYSAASVSVSNFFRSRSGWQPMCAVPTTTLSGIQPSATRFTNTQYPGTCSGSHDVRSFCPSRLEWERQRPVARHCARDQLRANTTNPFAGITTLAEAWNPCRGGPDASIPPPLPATIGLTQLS